MADPREFHINFMGDTMLGRLIDQLFPSHVHEPDEARHVESMRSRNPRLQTYTPESPWGTTLPLLRKADLNFLNLETAATTCRLKWPNKIFNYRMHPDNITALTAAHIDYAGLANNHTLDFSEIGLLDTVKTVEAANIARAGAGTSAAEAQRPAELLLPRTSSSGAITTNSTQHKIHIWAASDHPNDWSTVPLFHHIDFTPSTRARLKSLLTASLSSSSNGTTTQNPALKVFSIHWGPNYTWTPAPEIRALASFLIDECGIDIVHGHSSHHVQGVEKHGKGVVIYGCGDFVDDYAVVPGGWRNDLGAIWRVVVRETTDSDGVGGGGEGKGQGGLKVERLEVLPTKIEAFQAQLLEKESEEHGWVVGKVRGLSEEMGTAARSELGSEGQLIFDL